MDLLHPNSRILDYSLGNKGPSEEHSYRHRGIIQSGRENLLRVQNRGDRKDKLKEDVHEHQRVRAFNFSITLISQVQYHMVGFLHRYTWNKLHRLCFPWKGIRICKLTSPLPLVTRVTHRTCTVNTWNIL